MSGSDRMPMEDDIPESERGNGLSLIACTDMGCWFPDQETWLEFLKRKGQPANTTLDIDGEILFGPEK